MQSITPITQLPSDKVAAFSEALYNVLQRTHTQETLAHIIDGPSRSPDTSPTADSLSLSAAFVAAFQPSSLSFDTIVLQDFAAAAANTADYDLCLLNLLAQAIHNLAATLWREFHPDVTPPQEFTNEVYTAWERYPAGHAALVGYWAETRVFGGVVAFDHTPDGGVTAAWLDTGSEVWQLSAVQVRERGRMPFEKRAWAEVRKDRRGTEIWRGWWEREGRDEDEEGDEGEGCGHSHGEEGGVHAGLVEVARRMVEKEREEPKQNGDVPK
ncbi:hypothetical protein EDC01DRAFT_636897 [Geopyxis carbonaria]|nr:hypothetical protein EDC01DRAFT_636897 [Geopyxis carbonaria]